MRKFIFLSMVTLLSACGAADGTDQAEPATGSTAELKSELEIRFNAYARALFENDPQALAGLMSEEVKQRALEKGTDMQGFRDKMFKSMQTQLGGMSDVTMANAFSVSDVTIDGDSATIKVAFQGTPLDKPFYFVKEGEQYKLNLVRPGFSKPLPAGSAPARDTYLIQSHWAYNNGFGSTMTCNGGQVLVPDGTSKTVSCNNTCGWWHGSTFTLDAISFRNCDYNTWGPDVFIGPYDAGWMCNDLC
jgi:hypothetical protein